MAAIEKEFKVKLEAETSGFEAGIGKANAALGGLGSAAKLATIGVAAAAAASTAFFSLINRGQAVEELSNAFNNLYGKTQLLANDGLGRLRSATNGLVSDTNLLTQANIAAQAGMSPEHFNKLAAAADKLGDVVGKDTTQALEMLVAGMTKGNTRVLTGVGIFLKGVPAAKQYAEALRQIEEKAKNAGESSLTASDAITQLTNSLGTGLDQVAQWINKLPVLTSSFQGLTLVADKANAAMRGVFGTETASDLNDKIAGQNVLIANAERWQKKRAGFGFAPSLQADAEIAVAKKKIEELVAARDQIVGKANAAVAEPSNPKNPFNPFVGGAEKAKDKIKDVAEQLLKSLNEALSDAKLDALKKRLDSAIELGNFGEATKLRDQIQLSIESGVREAYSALGNNSGVEELAKIQGNVFADETTAAMSEANSKIADDMKDKMADALKESVDTFRDLFESLFSGDGDLGSLLKDFGLDLASTLAASIAKSFGVSLSGSDSPGNAIGTLLATLLVGSDVVEAAGTPAAGAPAAGAPSAEATGAAAADAVGAAAASGNPYVAVAVIVAKIILPMIIKAFEGTFGGTTNKDTLARRGLRDSLKQYFGEDLLAPTVKGNQQITQVDYKNLPQFLNNNPIGNQSVGLASTFGQVLGGGGKLGDDATAIFAQIIGQAGNFNEALVNTLGIMDKLGMSAGELKDSQKELFLDGKIELGQFGVALQNLNLLAQENLVGTGSVAEAWAIVTSATADNRTKLKALELAFKELSELGINDLKDIRAYMMEKFGPDAAAVFDTLGALGISTFGGIKDASADQIFAIFQALAGLKDDVATTFKSMQVDVVAAFSDTSTQITQAFVDNTKPLFTLADEVTDKYRAAAKDIRGLMLAIVTAAADAGNKVPTGSSSGSGVANGSVANNPFKA